MVRGPALADWTHGRTRGGRGSWSGYVVSRGGGEPAGASRGGWCSRSGCSVPPAGPAPARARSVAPAEEPAGQQRGCERPDRQHEPVARAAPGPRPAPPSGCRRGLRTAARPRRGEPGRAARCPRRRPHPGPSRATHSRLARARTPSARSGAAQQQRQGRERPGAQTRADQRRRVCRSAPAPSRVAAPMALITTNCTAMTDNTASALAAPARCGPSGVTPSSRRTP